MFTDDRMMASTSVPGPRFRPGRRASFSPARTTRGRPRSRTSTFRRDGQTFLMIRRTGAARLASQVDVSASLRRFAPGARRCRRPMTLNDRHAPRSLRDPLACSARAGWARSIGRRTRSSHRDVAIKVLPESLANDPDALARFEREAHAVAALNHPNILSIFDFGTHGDTAYAVMELLEGETLREILSEGAPPLRRAVEWARQIAARPGRGARKRNRPSRSEAGQHLRHERRPREDPRLRARETDREGACHRSDALPDRLRLHGAGHGDGNGRLHVSGAGERTRGRRPFGHLLLRCGALRDADRTTRVPARDRRGNDDGHSSGRSARAVRRGEEHFAGVRSNLAALPRKETGTAFPVGERHRVCARGSIGDLLRQAGRRDHSASSSTLLPGRAGVFAGMLAGAALALWLAVVLPSSSRSACARSRSRARTAILPRRRTAACRPSRPGATAPRASGSNSSSEGERRRSLRDRTAAPRFSPDGSSILFLRITVRRRPSFGWVSSGASRGGSSTTSSRPTGLPMAKESFS